MAVPVRPAARSRPCLRRRRTGGGRTSRSRPRRSIPRVRAGPATRRRDPREPHRRFSVGVPHRERQRPRAPRPTRPAPDPRLALQPAPVVSSMSSAPGSNTSKTRRPPGRSSPRAARSASSRSASSARWRYARNGQTTRAPARAPAGRGGRRGAGRAVADTRSAAGSGRPRASRRGVDADHVDAAVATGIATRPVPTPSSTTGPPACAPHHVEADVFRDAPAPLVVEPRDRRRTPMLGGLPRHPTNSRLSASNGRPSNHP